MRTVGGRIGSMGPRLKPPPKRAEPFYQSREWKALVRELRAVRGAWCERCGSTKGLVADHIVERKDGGADLDPANIELLCGKHHSAKTARARALRARGQAPQGGG